MVKNTTGQSSLEYVLLLAVIATLMTSVFRSERFEDFLGEEGSFFKKYAKEIGYNYRHGLPFGQDSGVVDYSSSHDTYKKKGESRPRFVIPLGEHR